MFPMLMVKSTFFICTLLIILFFRSVKSEGQWVCVLLHCPSRTFGCHIRRWTDVDNKLLHSNYTCFDGNKEFIVSVDESVEMLTNRDIDIDLESYVGAESDYSMGYRYGGYESAQGTVSPSGWSELKESAKNTRNTVESMKTFK